MKIIINPRGNGACPLCLSFKKCNYHKILHDAFDNTAKNDNMELVIYECPKFKFHDH